MLMKYSACISEVPNINTMVARQVIRHPARRESQEAANFSLYGALWLYVGQVRSDIQKAVLASLPTRTSFSCIFRQSWWRLFFFFSGSCEFDESVHLLSSLGWWVFLTGIPCRSGVTPVAFCSAQPRRKRPAHPFNICQYVLVCLWCFGWKIENTSFSCRMFSTKGSAKQLTWGMPIHSMVPKFENLRLCTGVTCKAFAAVKSPLACHCWSDDTSSMDRWIKRLPYPSLWTRF